MYAVKTMWMALFCLMFLLPVQAMAVETNCTDRVDDDGDSMTDCADSDCATNAACQPDGEPEASDARCTDWIDNDGNGVMDCDDSACNSPAISACVGSWDKAPTPNAVPGQASKGALPADGPGLSAKDMAAQLGDVAGERNDMVCSDGIDNDGDGRIDCDDVGCRLDEDVTVCRSDDSLRFSFFGRLNAYERNLETDATDTRFEEIAVRALGPVPMIQDSFFMVKVRLEKTPKLVWFLMRAPLSGSHYLTLHVGLGSLSHSRQVGNAKQLLLEVPYYMTEGFQASAAGAGLTLDGNVPGVEDGSLTYRLMGGGGNGRFFSVGGRYYPDDASQNYSFNMAAQLTFRALGYWSRWDSPFIYVPVPTTLVFELGGQYVQDPQERFPLGHAHLLFRWGHIHVDLEAVYRKELNFDSSRNAFRAELGVLLWPKTLFAAVDYGRSEGTAMNSPPASVGNAMESGMVATKAFRAALHYYVWRHVGTLSVLYVNQEEDYSMVDAEREKETDHRVSVQMKYGF